MESHIQPAGIVVVGGLGRMGSLIARFLREAGYPVTVADSAAGAVSWQDVAAHDVILLAVPLSRMGSVLEQIGPMTRTDGAVIDIASLKHEPVTAMLSACRGEVIGSHPLFGPRTSSLRDQIVFLCPARSGKWLAWFRGFLEGAGARVVDMEPQAHDLLMSRVQVLRHLLLICFGRTLMRLQFDLASELPLSGTWFTALVEMLARQLEQEGELYADLALRNPATHEVLEQFVRSVQEVTWPCASNDREPLIEVIEQVASFIHPETRGGT